MSDNPVRSAIGAALDYPFSEQAFALVDLIEANVRGFAGSHPGESATEITSNLIEIQSTLSLAQLWAILGANDAAVEEFGEAHGSTEDRIRFDLFVVLQRAVLAGLEAYDDEVFDALAARGYFDE